MDNTENGKLWTHHFAKSTGSAVVFALCEWRMITFGVELLARLQDVARTVLDAEVAAFTSLADNSNFSARQAQLVGV